MEFKRLIVVLTIAIFVTFSSMLGASYAWYAYENAEISLFGSTIKEAPTIIFSQTEYISSSLNMPIKDEDKENFANVNAFTITFGENLEKYETAISIVLDDIYMDEALKISNYKYELVGNNETIVKGDFSLLGDSREIVLLPSTVMEITNYPQTNTYELYIWLSEDDTNQNELMNKSFSGRVKINSASKKRGSSKVVDLHE